MTGPDDSAPGSVAGDPSREPVRDRGPRRAQVVAVTRPTPASVCLTLRTDLPDPGVEQVPAGHLSVHLPFPTTVDGRSVTRTYTPLRLDHRAGTVDIVVVLHGPGAGTRWATAAAVDDVVAVSRWGGRPLPDPTAELWWLVADECAVPALGTVVDSLPANATVEAHAVVTDRHEERLLGAPTGASLHWHHRRHRPPGPALEEVLAAHPPPPGARCWVAGEAVAVRRIRTGLGDLGHPPGSVTARGYWRAGRPEGVA